MNYVEAPYRDGPDKSLFLGGGITGCPDWQTTMVYLLGIDNLDLMIYNPRRKNFPIDDPEAAYEQIRWEHQYLAKATAILFWFPRESLCPIALYELGKWTPQKRKLFIGCDPKYARIQDIQIQTALERPDLLLHYTLDALANEVRQWAA